MITETIHNEIQCATKDEYERMVEYVNAANIPVGASIVYDTILNKITIHYSQEIKDKTG